MPQGSHRTFDVAVAGGGIIGLAVAWRAQRHGLKTVLLERDARVAQGATHAAAGMLAPVSEANVAEQELLRLGLESAARYPAFVAELAEQSPLDAGFLRCGTLVVARDRDEAEALDRERDARARLGLEVERLLPSEARRREPGLAPTLRLALDVPEDHAVDPRGLAAALADAFARAGGDLRTGTPVARVTTSATGERVSGVELDDGERIAAAQVVVATGAWTQALGGIPTAARVPVRPVKGQILRLRDPAGPGLFTRVLRMDPGYLVPRGDGRYVLGATMEERGYDTDVTAGGVFELLRDASELVPGISELVLEELEAGLRPGTPDNAPALGPGALEGLHWAAGHHRNGILLAPVTADLLLASLTGAPLGELATPFTPDRFTTTPTKDVAA
ncbi:glycine oxidase ThiO [Conexibacter stalactiti]|uniref:glycine oxidase n=1 Tax=Conexibacter stalactiti TaxID=1940611 RepID=A0ABU4HMB5_9ACTN|nr:glycine oxidase ThiO [Conexibacter stalactiti]MDW5594441.1 glycine oxidase ThiO [Conexibacter stalactiti]MEC5035083.1 glycine oxidase ThiO [Conexibacter stalactiti]